MSRASERPRPLQEIAAAKTSHPFVSSIPDPVQLVLSRVPDARQRGNGWVARCPAHDDRVPSLSIAQGKDGRALVRCFGGCPPETVVSKLELTMRDLMPPGNGFGVSEKNEEAPTNGNAPRRAFGTAQEALALLERTHGPHSAKWTYHDTSGDPVGVIVRWDRPGGAKDIRPISRTGSGWIIGAMPEPRPIYGLPRVVAADHAAPIFVCEGEACAEAAQKLGLVSTTSSGGAKAAHKSDWSPLAGRDVIILPDNDKPGESFAQDVARILKTLSPPAQTRVLRLPSVKSGDDIVDFIRLRREAGAADDAIKSEIEALAEEASPPETVEQAQRPSLHELDRWPSPQSLPDELPPVAPFDFDLLPETLCPWIKDIAERVQCPPDFPAIAVMITIATIVGRKIGIRPKRKDDWLVVPNLYGAAIGPPSVMKTPAIQEPLKVLKRLEIEAKAEFDRAMAVYEASEMVAKERRRKAQKDIRSALYADGDGEDPLELARESLTQEEQRPVRQRYLINDTTVEKLGEILNQNPNGVLCYRDELIGLLKALEKEGQEGARAFYLEAWNGTGRYTYDRIARGTIDIDAAILSIIGSIQPGPLQSYLSSAVQGGAGADGLMQRFQLAVYPDISKDWKNVDRCPDSKAKDTAFELFRRLDQSKPEDLGGQLDPHDPDGIRFTRFEPSAQSLFDDWRADLEHRLRAGIEHPVITAHLAKYRSLIPSLALLIHLIEGYRGSVCLEALKRAIAWGKYLESHAKRIYAVAISPDLGEARELAVHILSGDLGSEFSLRDVYRNGWIALGTRESASRAVEMLCDLDWLAAAAESTSGRPRTRFYVNPKTCQFSGNQGDKTAKRSGVDPSVGFVSAAEGETTVSDGSNDASTDELGGSADADDGVEG